MTIDSIISTVTAPLVLSLIIALISFYNRVNKNEAVNERRFQELEREVKQINDVIEKDMKLINDTVKRQKDEFSSYMSARLEDLREIQIELRSNREKLDSLVDMFKYEREEVKAGLKELSSSFAHIQSNVSALDSTLKGITDYIKIK